jgi:hypothetical protein
MGQTIVAEEGQDVRNPSFPGGYRAISLSLLKLSRFSAHCSRASLTFSLIFVANRFNTPYYLGLNTGEWSGGETNKVVDVCGCGGYRQIVEAPEVPAAD